jgi:hypothetical protein
MMKSDVNVPPPDAILMQMLFAPLMQRSICVATKLGIADALAEKPQTAAELATKTETHAPSLYRLLRTLASIGIFAETSDQKFELTPLAELLRKDSPNSMRDTVIMFDEPWLWSASRELTYSVKTGGIAHDKIQGMSSFEFFEKNKEAGEIFYRAMTNMSLMSVPAILEAYDFSEMKTIVDIAGGHGVLLSRVLKSNPQAHGILFDLPHVIHAARELLNKEGISDRVELASGDFFHSLPAGGDGYVMKHIIHDWNDEHCITVLKNIRAVMNEHAKVLIIEMVVPEGNVPSPSKALDLVMLLVEGGKERTAKEYRTLLDASGFQLTRIIPTKSPNSIIEAVRK